MAQRVVHLDSYRNAPVILGESSEGGRVLVSQEALESGTYILGKQGSGKSSLLLSIILQQIRLGDCVVVVDPHGDLIYETLLRMIPGRLSDVVLLDTIELRTFPFGMNLFALDPGRERSAAKEAVLSQCIQAFGKLWSETKSGQYFEEILRFCISLLVEFPELTMAHIPLVLADGEFRRRYTSRIKNLMVRNFWRQYENWGASKQEERSSPLVRRVNRLLSNEVIASILCQKEAWLDLRTMISQKKIILLNLHMKETAYEYSAQVIGTFFVSLLHSATFGLSHIPYDDRPGYSLIVDEFSNFGSDESYEKFFTEGRKYKVKQFLAHQYRGQLDKGGSSTNKEATTSANTIVCMGCTAEDSKEMAGEFVGLPREERVVPVDSLSLLKKHPDDIVRHFYWRYIEPATKADYGDYHDGFSQRECTIALQEFNTFLYHIQRNRRSEAGEQKEMLERLTTVLRCYTMEKVSNERVEEHTARLEKQIVQLNEQAEKRKEESKQQREFETEQAVAKEKQNPPVPPPNQHEEENKALQEQITALEKEAEALDNNIGREGYGLMWLKNYNRRRTMYSSEPIEETLARYERYVSSPGSVPEKEREQWVYEHKEYIRCYRLREQIRRKAEIIGRLRNTIASNNDADQERAYKVVWEYKSRIRRAEEDGVKRASEERWKIEQERYEAVSRVKQKIEELIPQKTSSIRVIFPDFVEKFTQSVAVLLADPFTSDTPVYSPTELADLLKKLERQHALAKVGSLVSRLRTLDIRSEYPAVSPATFDTRLRLVLAQTIRGYCRPLAQVEREIAEVYEQDIDIQERDLRIIEADPLPEKRISEQGKVQDSALLLPPMPKRKEISGWDVFDKSEF